MDDSKTVEIQCTMRPIDRAKVHSQRNSATEQAITTNWSGYVAAPSLQQSIPNSVSYVAGSWIVPKLLPTTDLSYCTIWAGIDGFLDGTIAQIGTGHDWIDSIQSNYAWFEMYPMGTLELEGFLVNIGDQIGVHIGYKGSDVFKLVIYNYTQGVSTTVPSSYTTVPNFQRSSAEWIVEAPFAEMVLSLADFKLATFNYCSATINGVTGGINNGNWVDDSIQMTGTSGVKANPSALLKNGTSFTVTWEHE